MFYYDIQQREGKLTFRSMQKITLKNKPLVEAICELRWELQEAAPGSGVKIDPHYKILVGTIYDRLKQEYPFHEPLPTASIPDEVAAYVIQHRFRKGKDQWPLIQVGPGIITLNDTGAYRWDDFERRISIVVDKLFEAYPDPTSLKISQLVLRYIDAIEFDYHADNVFRFMEQMMKIRIAMPQKLFKDTGVAELPLDFDVAFAFSSAQPRGSIHLRFMRGKKRGTDALIWETIFQSVGEDAPSSKEDIRKWAQQAHELIVYKWFLKIIEGELRQRFE